MTCVTRVASCPTGSAVVRLTIVQAAFLGASVFLVVIVKFFVPSDRCSSLQAAHANIAIFLCVHGSSQARLNFLKHLALERPLLLQ